LGVSPAAGPAGGAVLAARWPLRSALDLGALPGAVPCARLHARQVVWEWGLGRLAATVCSPSLRMSIMATLKMALAGA
jgi:hypothetical protein